MQARRWITVAVICVLVFVVLAGYKALLIRDAIAFGESFPEQSETVEVTLTERKPWAVKITALGEVVAPQSVELRNELEGKIAVVGFGSGVRVKKGQLLLQLDASEEQAQLQAAQAEAELAELALQRYAKLMKSNASSKDQYDQARAENAIAIARAKALQATIDKKTLIAPFDADSGLHQLEPGQFLSANTLITQLVGVSNDVWVDFYLPQQQAALALGNEVRVSAKGLLAEPAPGKIIAKDSALSSSSRNLHFRAVVSGIAAAVKPGTAVDVAITDASHNNPVVIPAAAVRYDTLGNYVYVIRSVAKKAEKDNAKPVAEWRAEKRMVTLGAEQSQQVVVTDGLQPGEKIAVNGAYKLRENMLVNIKQEPLGGAAGNGQTGDRS